MNKTLMLVVGMSVAGLSQSALADNQYAVSYSKQELKTVQGIQDVHARIVRVAKRHCPTYFGVRRFSDGAECVADVVNDLVEKVNHPELSRYHANDEGVRIAADERRNSDAG